MTTYYPFTPTLAAPFKFQPTLDGQVYVVTCPWNVHAQRWYMQVVALDGTLIVFKAISSSPSGNIIESISWAQGVATLVTSAPHRYRPLSTINLTVSGCQPDAFNGKWQMFVVDDQTLSFSMGDPGVSGATALGQVSWDLNLVGGYFSQSTLVFREQSNQFEVNP